jgi:mannose-6-phosphate isomerase class I
VRADDSTDRWQTLLDTPAFRLDHGRVRQSLELTPQRTFALLTVLAGAGSLHSGTLAHPLQPGDTLLVLGEARLEGEDLELLSVEAPA